MRDEFSISGRHFPGLTGMRGVAVMLVLLFHSNIVAGGRLIFSGATLGVDMFFVLSGFLITSLIMQERINSGSFDYRRFYLKRLRRLGPALIVMIAVFLLLSALFAFPVALHGALRDSAAALFYVSNWTRALGYDFPEYLGHTWSLSIEEQFYIVWPAALLLLVHTFKRKGLILSIAALVCASWFIRCWMTAHGATFDRVYNGSDTRADGLLFGALVAAILASSRLTDQTVMNMRKWLRYVSPLSAITLLVIATIGTELSHTGFYATYTAVYVLTSVLILDCVFRRDGIVQTVLCHPVLVWLGVISYGLYLWHFPITIAVMKHGVSGWARFAVNCGAGIPLAAASYYFVERRFLIKKDAFGRRTGTQTA